MGVHRVLLSPDRMSHLSLDVLLHLKFFEEVHFTFLLTPQRVNILIEKLVQLIIRLLFEILALSRLLICVTIVFTILEVLVSHSFGLWGEIELN